MDAMNFNVLKRGDVRESNYRLRGEPVQLNARMTVVGGEGVDVWESEGGSLQPPTEESSTKEILVERMRVRGARKQTAARALIPRESITLVPLKGVCNATHVIRELDSASVVVTTKKVVKKVVVEELEARLKVLLALVLAKGGN